jgi:hypothetical protein
MMNVLRLALVAAALLFVADSAEVWEPDPGDVTVTDDAYTLAPDSMLVVPAPGPLVNDSSSTGKPLSFVLTSGHDYCLSLPDGTLAVTPPHLGYRGVATLSYQARDADGMFATGKITVTIAERGSSKAGLRDRDAVQPLVRPMAIANVLDGLQFKNPATPGDHYYVRAVER